MEYAGLTQSVQVILRALDLLELGGEYREGNQLDREFIRRLTARESVQIILLRVVQQLEQGEALESIASSIAREYGAFLRDAVIAVHSEREYEQEPTDLLSSFPYPALARHKERGERRLALQELHNRREAIITVDWLPETAREEARRFLHYLENRTRASAQGWIRALLAQLGVESLEALIESLKASPCVQYYESQSEYLVLDEARLREWLAWHNLAPEEFEELVRELDIPQPVYQYFTAYRYKEIEELFSCSGGFPYEYNRAGKLLGFFYSELVLENHMDALLSWHRASEAALLVRSLNACGSCASCFAMEQLIRLCERVWQLYSFWLYPEACSFVFKGTPLPPRVGHAFQYDLDAFRTEPHSDWAEQRTAFYERLTQELYSPVQLVQLPNIELRCLPILSAESLASIQQRLGMFAEPRQLALLLHDHLPLTYEDSGNRLDLFPVLDERSKEPIPVRRDLRLLLSEWNRLAPPAWQYRTRSAKVNFCRALHRAKRALRRLER